MTSSDSNPRRRAGQPGRVAFLARGGGTVVLLLCVLGFVGVGCRNLYQEGTALYPSQSGDRLRLRLDEAIEAGQRATQAAAALHRRLERDPHSDRIESDLDRLETASLDLIRRVAAARAEAVQLGMEDEVEAELERLEQSATLLLKEVQEVRGNPAVPERTANAGIPS